MGKGSISNCEEEMNKKWYFLVESDWEIHKNWFAVDLFGLNISKGFFCVTLFGFSFIMERGYE